MKLNNVEIYFSNLEISAVDQELVIYNPATEQVMTLNKTASIIWQYISQFSDTDENISTDDIVDELKHTCSIQDDNYLGLKKDVEELLQLFNELQILL